MRFARHPFAEAVDRLGQRGFLALAKGGAMASTTLGPTTARGAAQTLLVIDYLRSRIARRAYARRLTAFREGLAKGRLWRGATSPSNTGGPTASTMAGGAGEGTGPGAALAVMVAPGGAEESYWRRKRRRPGCRSSSRWGAIPSSSASIQRGLARPGGNLTGVSSLSVEVSRKRRWSSCARCGPA